MPVEDYIKPLEFHKFGFPKTVADIIKNLNTLSHPQLKELALQSYEQLLIFIDRGLKGKGVKLEEEAVAAEYVSHLILDAAVLHNTCCRIGLVTEDFPYDYLTDKILLPKKDKHMDKGEAV